MHIVQRKQLSYVLPTHGYFMSGVRYCYLLHTFYSCTKRFWRHLKTFYGK